MDHRHSAFPLTKPQNQAAVLFTEIGVWLHLLGKFSSQFIHDQHFGKGKQYKSFYEKINRPLKQVYGCSWSKIGFPKFSGVQWPNDLAQFSEQHDKPRFAKGKAVISLVADAHGRGSGTEKGLFDQHTCNSIGSERVHLDSVFGHTLSILDLPKLDSLRDDMYDFLEEQIPQLMEKLKNKQPVEWLAFRRELVKHLHQGFSATVGDTRRPINDVSLWDQTAASVAFFKSGLVKNFLTGSWQNPRTSKYTWQLVRVGIDGLAFWGKSDRISDLIARRELISKALDRVRHILDITLPISMEVYRDENGSIFLLPDLPEILDWKDENGSTLGENMLSEAQEVLGGEICPALQQDTRPSRTLYSFGELASKVPSFLSADAEIAARWWNSGGKGICSACGLRPEGFGADMIDEYKNDPESYRQDAEGRKLCCVCLYRMTGRAKMWVAQALNRGTIWLDEVADEKAQVAILVGRFDLTNWLTGGYVSSLLTVDPVNINGYCYGDLVSDIQKSVPDTLLTNLPVLSTLLDQDVIKALETVEILWASQVEDADLARYKDLMPRQQLLALALVRKTPSFARIRRIWETTHRFWKEVMPTEEDAKIAESLAGQRIGRAGPRLAMQGTLRPNRSGNMLGSHCAYELVLTGGIKVSVLWVNDRFVTCDNLGYLEKQLDKPIQVALSGGLKIEEPTGYGARNKEWGEIEVQDVQEIPDSIYTPAIPILAEPRTFMALVPADKALEVVKGIREKYEREMGKVRNRLPLHLGIVYAGRHKPLRAILDAGRRMLQQKPWGGHEPWTVRADAVSNTLPEKKRPLAEGTRQFDKAIHVELEKNDHSLTWSVPALMGDGDTWDNWYPYVFLKTDIEPTDRKRRFLAPNPLCEGQSGWLVHASELKEGDKVYFTSATIDWLWMDTTARRFEIAYDEIGQRLDPALKRRPYLLDELESLETMWQTLSAHLTSTQIHSLNEIIEEKRETWKNGNQPVYEKDRVFYGFCRDAVANAEWRKGRCGKRKDKMPWNVDWQGQDKDSWLDTWADYAARGWLADAVELYITIMRQQPEREKEA